MPRSARYGASWNLLSRSCRVRLHLGCMTSRSSVTSRSCRPATASCAGPGPGPARDGCRPSVSRIRTCPGLGRVCVSRVPSSVGERAIRRNAGWIRVRQVCLGPPLGDPAKGRDSTRGRLVVGAASFVAGRSSVDVASGALYLTGAANKRAHSGDQLHPEGGRSGRVAEVAWAAGVWRQFSNLSPEGSAGGLRIARRCVG
jgi:hypothetical protein